MSPGLDINNYVLTGRCFFGLGSVVFFTNARKITRNEATHYATSIMVGEFLRFFKLHGLASFLKFCLTLYSIVIFMVWLVENGNAFFYNRRSGLVNNNALESAGSYSCKNIYFQVSAAIKLQEIL